MTLQQFLRNYGGSMCVSIEGYCEEAIYDYYYLPTKEKLSNDNPNGYVPTCIAKESWWKEVKNKKVAFWNIIGGGIYPVELCITLKKED